MTSINRRNFKDRQKYRKQRENCEPILLSFSACVELDVLDSNSRAGTISFFMLKCHIFSGFRFSQVNICCFYSSYMIVW